MSNRNGRHRNGTKRTALFHYRSYNFVDKDPVCYAVRDMIQEEGLKFSQVERLSGTMAATINNWINGDTRCPRFASVVAVASALGYSTLRIDKGGVRFTKEKDLNYERELDRAAKEFVDGKGKRGFRLPVRVNGNGAHVNP